MEGWGGAVVAPGAPVSIGSYRAPVVNACSRSVATGPRFPQQMTGGRWMVASRSTRLPTSMVEVPIVLDARVVVGRAEAGAEVAARAPAPASTVTASWAAR